jgi:hypothetical protein
MRVHDQIGQMNDYFLYFPDKSNSTQPERLNDNEILDIIIWAKHQKLALQCLDRTLIPWDDNQKSGLLFGMSRIVYCY